MFKTLNSGNHTGVVTVHVGPGRVVGSVAAFGVDSPLELIRVLNKLG